MVPSPHSVVSIHEAICSRDGSGGVHLGASLNRTEAIRQRLAGGDVVVCGPDPFANAREAHAIESGVGPCVPDGPHVDVAGVLALPHFQQRSAPPDGHTFYETPVRKAIP